MPQTNQTPRFKMEGWQAHLTKDRYHDRDLTGRRWSAENLVTYWMTRNLPPMVRVSLLQAVGVRKAAAFRIVARFGHKMLSLTEGADATAIGTYETFAKDKPSGAQIGQLRTVLEVRQKGDPANYEIIGALKLIEAVQVKDRESAFRHLQYSAGIAASAFVDDYNSEETAEGLASDWFQKITGGTFRIQCEKLRFAGKLD